MNFQDEKDSRKTELENLEKEVAMSKPPSRKKYGFSNDSNEKYFDEIVNLGY